MSLGNTWRKLERDALYALLEACEFKITRAAKAAGVSERLVKDRAKFYGIELPQRTTPGPRRRRRSRARRFRLVAPRTWQPVPA